MAVQTSGIDHVHLNVTDIAAFIDRFTALLACEHNIPLYVDSLQALNSMNSLGLDVFQPIEVEGIAAKQMSRFGGPGITTVSLHVDDLDAATAHIEECGVRCMSQIGYPGVERQSQFRPRDCFGMVLELVEYVPGHEQVIAEIKARQALENDGRTGIASKPGALETSGIEHVHLCVGDLDAARRWFSQLFACEWEDVKEALAGRATRSSIGVHLLEAEAPGLGHLAFGVTDLDAARRLTERLGLVPCSPSGHGANESCLGFEPAGLGGLALEFVGAEPRL